MSLRKKIIQQLGGVDRTQLKKRVIARSAASYGNSPRRKMMPSKTKVSSNQNVKALAAGQITRLTSDWLGITRTINSDIRAGLARIRARARQAALEDPYAKKILRMYERNVVGPNGFILRAKVMREIYDEKIKGLRYEKDREVNRLIELKFKQWQNKKFATLLGNISFRRACQLIVKCTARDGEIFVIEKKEANKFGYTLQLVESDYCDETFNYTLSNGNVVVMGVEINKQRQVQAYWFRQPRPETEASGGIYGGKRTRIEASKVIHIFAKESPFQLRGISWLAPVLLRLKMLSAYEEASLIAARVAANQTLILEKKDGHTGPGPNTPNIAGSTEDDNNNIIQPLAPGEVWISPTGYKPSNYTPNAPNEKQHDFTEHNLRGIATGGDVSFINLANNYSQVNYTSSRTNLLEERDAFEDLHAWCKEDFLEDIGAHWLEMACLAGALPREWLLDFDYYNKLEFRGRVWDWVDPEKAANANIKDNLNNMKTLEEIYDEKGKDWEEELEQLDVENQFLLKKGLRRELQQVVNIGEQQTDNDNSENGNNGKAKYYESYQ